MNILIEGVGFVNKGAELMLYSIVEKIKLNDANAQIVLHPYVYSQNRKFCVAEGILPLKIDVITTRQRIKHLIRKIRQKANYILPENIDVILDAGGFQFSDQWLHWYEKYTNQDLRNYYSTFNRNCKFVFLPQAFGPFKNQITIDRIRIVHEFATLIYAREEKSLSYLYTVFSDNTKIRLSPDFTCLLKPKVPLCNLMDKSRPIVFVGNKKMISGTSDEVSVEYLRFCADIIERLIQRGENIVLLNHEGKEDEELLAELNNLLSQKQIILTGLNALEIKAIIGKCSLLISSRFHGVVSGLSQGIPTFCTSWSHKYEQLLKNYNVIDNILDIKNREDSYSKIERVLNGNGAKYLPAKESIENNEKAAQFMWKEVFDLIK